jgi:hypothetical protein
MTERPTPAAGAIDLPIRFMRKIGHWVCRPSRPRRAASTTSPSTTTSSSDSRERRVQADPIAL